MKFSYQILVTAFLIFVSPNYRNTLCQEINSVEFNFDQLTIQNGLSSNSINSIIQDQKGFLWFGTEDGLNRFDGYTFKVYRNKRGDNNSLSNNFIWSICEDKNGMIWIGTDGGGLNKFNPVTEIFERFVNDNKNQNSLSSDVVQNVFVDSKNNLWISTWGGGLNLYDRKINSFKRFRHNPADDKSIGSDKIFFVFEDSKSRIWAGTEEGGLNLFDNKSESFIKFKHNPADKNSISFNNVTSMIEMTDSSFLIGTSGGGLNKFLPEQNKFKKISTGDFKNIWKIFLEKDGTVWCGSSVGEGVCILSPAKNEVLVLKNDKSEPSSITSNDIRSFFKDNTNVMWIGTTAGGLNKIDRKPKKFIQINPDNSDLPDNFVFTLEEDKNNDIWIGTYNKGVTRFDPQKKSFINYPPSGYLNGRLNGEIARYIFNDRKDNLWVGTFYGLLNQYDFSTNKFFYKDLNINKNNPSANLVRVIYEDSEGLLWFGAIGGGGLTSFNRLSGEYKHYSSSQKNNTSVSGDDITSICEDKNGDLWIGTYSFGLNRFHKKTNEFKQFVREENNSVSLPDNIITDIHQDVEGNLWAATYSGGLCKYNYEQNSFEILTEDNGFASNSIYGILEDEKNNLWLSTSKGITKFNYNNYVIKNYDQTDGVQQPEFNPSARLKTKNGYMYFGGVNGITYFHPDSIREETYSSNISITSFKVFNEEKKLPESITYTDSITLGYDENVFSFEFTSLDFTSPEKNSYAYMLEGFDLGWVNTGSRRFVNYTHLDPGEYRFKVKAANSVGNWSLPASVILIIKPPFWMTWWFRAIMLIAFLSVGPIFYFKRVNQLKKEKSVQVEFSKQLIRSQEIERKRIASELHDSLGQDLLVIKNLALLNKSKDEQFEEISKTAGQALDEVRRISYNLHPYQLDRLGLTKAISSMFNNIESVSGIKFDLQIENVDNLFNKEQEINIYRIVQECVNNILKHSGANTAAVTIQKLNDGLYIYIADNGKGFDFELMKSESKGFGLKNMANRISFLDGEIEYDKSVDYATIIKIKIPIEIKN